jgi:hypothetical protein
MKYPIFLNSIPKSGTHLLSKALMGLPGVSHSGSHLERKKIAEFVDPGVDFPVEGREDMHIPNDMPAITRLLASIQPGQFITAHMIFNYPVRKVIRELGYKKLLLFRDPRDVVVSWANFIVKEETHLLYPFFSETDFNFRIISGIRGVPGDITGTRRQEPINELMTRYVRWKTEGDAFFVKFEDLIGDKGGGSRESQQKMIKGIADYFEIDCPDEVIDQVCDSLFGGTYTFNKGMIGAWREHFTEAHKSVFKEETGDLLIQLGYESDMDW